MQFLKVKREDFGFVFWWVIFTFFYTILSTAQNNLIFIRGNEVQPGEAEKIYQAAKGFLGLFVPIGPQNWLFVLLNPLVWVTVLGVFLPIAYLIKKQNLKEPKMHGIFKFLGILIFLFLITLIIDFLVFECWQSLTILELSFLDNFAACGNTSWDL